MYEDYYKCIEWLSGFTVGSTYRIKHLTKGYEVFNDDGMKVILNQQEFILHFEEV